MATENTGYLGHSKLVKITTDGTDRQLDDNNNLVSDSGMLQSVKNNDFSDTDYIPPVEDHGECPLPA